MMNEKNMTTGGSPVMGSVSLVLKPIRGRLILASMLTAVGAMFTLIPLAGIVYIAQFAFGQDDIMVWIKSSNQLWIIVIISLISLLLSLLLASAGEWVAHLADNYMTNYLRLAITRRLSRVSLGWFTSRASGEVKQVMQDDIAALHSLTAHFFTTMARSVGTVVIYVIYLFVMDWRMAVASLLPFPVFFLFFHHAQKSSEANMQVFAAGMAGINNAVVEFINGIPVVKAFAVGGKAHSRYREAVDNFAMAFAEFARPLISAMANAHAMIAPVSILGFVFAFGAMFVWCGWITPMEVLPFALVAPGLCAPLLLLSYITHDLNSATGAAQRVHAILNTPILETMSGKPQAIPAHADIHIENLSYAPDGQNPLLTNINFTLKSGSVTAIVGASGSGKSTLARLLLRFFDPTEGRITIGDIDLRELDSRQLYRHIGFVLQEARLIHASIRDNIALGRPDASQQEIENAAGIANIHQRILSLPAGYDSLIGEDVQLSGGELQRICIARAVLLDPPVLVLDEATSAADAENEVKIQQALSRFIQGRTLLVIAHRLDTVIYADHIIVMNNGSICEQGTHAELLALNGRYAHLWQRGGYEKNENTDGAI